MNELRRFLGHCCVMAAAMSALAGCSSGQVAVPLGTPTPTVATTSGQPVPRLVVITEAKSFVRTGPGTQSLFVLQPLATDAKVNLSLPQMWARISGKDSYFDAGSVAYLGLYADPGTKVSRPAYVTVGGPLSIPRCQTGFSSATPSARQSGVPVGEVTLCYRIFVMDADTGEVLQMMDADIPE